MNRSLRTLNAPQWKLAAAISLAWCLGACSLAPRYSVPEAAHSASFKEAANLPPGIAERWKQAQPSEEMARGDWWKVFEDGALDGYEATALSANQDLKAAFARLQQVRALQQVADSQRYPTLDAGFGSSRQRSSPGSLGIQDGNTPGAQTVWRAQAAVSYEVDLFGRVSAMIDAAEADTQRSEALLRSVQLTIQADVAACFFSLRELDAEAELLDGTVELRVQELAFVQHRFDAGDVSGLEVAQAKTELTSARSDALTVTRRRAAQEHVLAVLVGYAPSEMTVPSNPLVATPVRIPAGIPSSLLERRPDIAAAERAMAAENARIGVARSAYFPSLSLTGIGGFESASLGDLFKWSSRAFLLGPLVGTALNIPIFDGGQRRGNLENAKAKYEEAAADYRQQVLIAFKEVEDNLAELRILEDQMRVQDESVSASHDAAQLSRTQFENGSVSYLNVIDSERTLLQSRRAAIQLVGAQTAATVNLIRALGGGWSTPADTVAAPVALATLRQE